MKSGGMLIVGGLLQGLGKGVENEWEARRQAALAELQRQQAVEDRDAKLKGAQTVAETEAAGRLAVVKETGAENRQTEETRGTQARLTEVTKGAEARTTKAFEVRTDAAMEKLKSALKTREDAVSKKLAYELDQGGVQSVQVGADGTPVVVYKDGRTEERPGIKLQLKGSADDDTGSISAAIDKRNGKAPAPAAASAVAKPANSETAHIKGQALAQLPGLYAQIEQNPQKYRTQYPGMFDANGNLLPISVLKQRIDQRYQ